MLNLGIRLQLLAGGTIPVPVPYEVVDSLLEVQVTNNDERRDGFELTFSLGRGSGSRDFGLLQNGLFNPPNRVTIMVFINGLPQVLINGAATKHQMIPSNEPGEGRLKVTGEDLGVLLDLEAERAVFRNLPDSAIVQQVLADYSYLIPMVTPTTDVAAETERVTTQYETDLAFIHELARRNSFTFYTEPSPVPGTSIAYWGPADQPGVPQPALSVDMGSFTNVERLDFDFNALGPVTPVVSILEPLTQEFLALPGPSALTGGLASQSASALRREPLPGAARLSPAQALLQAQALASSGASDAVTGGGELDAVRYGRALRSRHKVGVRGVGASYDGDYYVKQVTHRISRGEYKQSFTLRREGLGAVSQVVIS